MAEQEQNRSEDATPFKLEEARKRGSLPKSTELNTLGIMVVAAMALAFLGHGLFSSSADFMRDTFSRAGSLSFDLTHVAVWLPRILERVLYLILPVFLIICLAAIVINLIQTGPIFTFFPLRPDFERINPVAGIKKLFTIRVLIELIKTLIKIGVLGATLYFFIQNLLPGMSKLFFAEPVRGAFFLIDETRTLILKLCVAFLLVTLIDMFFTRRDFRERMRMSRREVKEENKRREGDPRIRQKIRELQRENLKRSGAIGNVKDADVLITNPQHLAIALQYRRGEMSAPVLLAKGAGELAAEMRALARRHGVPIVENKKLARAMFRESGIGQGISEKYFPQVAKILASVFAARQGSKNNLAGFTQ